MAQIIIAPSIEKPKFISLFLAGGITNCKNWQDEVIKELEFEDVSIFNPRQINFNINDKSASFKQISWEFERLEQMEIFSMYFCESSSDQPICMYELGRNIIRMQNRFPFDWQKRIVIGIEENYKRKQDVVIQLSLCAPTIFVDTLARPTTHAQYIKNKIRQIRG